jgi:hypothetical protein
MVYTVRFAGGKGGKTKLEVELRRLGILQKNSRPNHPTTCGKVERFQQTMKKWLVAQPDQPSTIAELQALLDRFRDEYNTRRPPLPQAPGNPRRGLHQPSQGHPQQRPQPRHPRPRPHRQDRQGWLGHPAPQRPAPPHRCRPDLRRNLRPTPRPRPRHHHHQRRHRRTPPRAHPRPHPRLPTHRRPQRPHPKNDERTCEMQVRCRRCLETSHGGPPTQFAGLVKRVICGSWFPG